MDLTQLDDRPELEIEIGGLRYGFGEIPIGRLAGLEQWLRRATPNPIEEARGRIAGLPPEDRAAVLRVAQEQARGWRLPTPGTAAFMGAVLAVEEGQWLAFREALAVHHPDVGEDDARRLYRLLQRDAIRRAREARRAGAKDDGEGDVQRIYSVAFGFGDPLARDEEPLPEASAPGPPRRTGG